MTKPQDKPDKPILGYCSTHPHEPAKVAVHDRATDQTTRYCLECWRNRKGAGPR